jgi:exodeoxyribonuclease VIII
MHNEFSLGVYTGIASDDYHQDREYISSSVIKCAYDSIPKYKERYVDGKEGFDSDAMRIGRAFHTRTLEPEKFNDEWTVFDNRENKLTTKDGKFAYAEFKQNCIKDKKCWLTQSEHEDVEAMAHTARANKFVSPLLTPSAQFEVSLFSLLPDTDIKVKIRADMIDFKNGVIVDLKSTRDARLDSFRRDALYNMHYDLSAALYIDVVQELMGRRFEYLWIAVDKTEPYTTAVYKCSDSTYLRGKEKYLTGLRNIITATKENDWSYQQNIGEI